MQRFIVSAILLAASILPSFARADVVIIRDDAAYGSDYGTTFFAHPGGFGLGIGGTSLVSGLTGKLYFGSIVALQATVGWWYAEGPEINADVIFEMPRIVRGRNASLNWNLGVGGAVGFATAHPYSDGSYATVGGVNGVLGLGLQFRPFPLELVVELRPTYFVGPEGVWNGFFFGAGAAARFFFW